MLVGDIGVGLFILIVVWLSAIIAFVLGIKYQNNVSWIALGAATCFTIILVAIPLERKDQVPEVDLEKDYYYKYQVLFLIFIFLSCLLGFTYIFLTHCLEPIRPKALKSVYQ